MKWKLMIGAVAAAALAAAGGIAYAAATGGTPSGYDACAKTQNGLLRLVNGGACDASEQSVRLGAPAHVDEWAWYQGPGGGIPIVSGVWPGIRGHETTVLTFHLDQGQYLVATQLIAINNDGHGVVVCQTGNHALGISLLQGAVGQGPGMAIQQTMQSQTVFDVPTPQDLTVDCFNAPPNDPAGYPFINEVDVTASKIDSSTFAGTPNP
ncbi:MAG TPA: hypothetical protein VGK79_13405 [Gaiellaceae bacterium]|jgi:hypothetical protein